MTDASVVDRVEGCRIPAKIEDTVAWAGGEGVRRFDK
jgi:hypothetical protein